jgi:hypothetical protein
MLFEAVKSEAENPTGDNLPQSPDDPRAKRIIFDDSLGRSVVTYKARESFIKGLSRPARRIIIHDPMSNRGYEVLKRSAVRFG